MPVGLIFLAGYIGLQLCPPLGWMDVGAMRLGPARNRYRIRPGDHE
jgi:hypothetical protein